MNLLSPENDYFQCQMYQIQQNKKYKCSQCAVQKWNAQWQKTIILYDLTVLQQNKLWKNLLENENIALILISPEAKSPYPVQTEVPLLCRYICKDPNLNNQTR